MLSRLKSMTTVTLVLAAAVAASKGMRPAPEPEPEPRVRPRRRFLFAATASVLALAIGAALFIGQPAQARPAQPKAEFHLASITAPVVQLPADFKPIPQLPADFTPIPDTRFQWPARGPLWSPFGPRTGEFHTGDDIGAPRNSTIVAPRAGTVVFAGVESGYGNETRIDHGDGLVTVYAHQAKISVRVGQQVERGQAIGLVGSTGRVTAPHLHFEVRVNNVPRDPMRWLRDALD